MKMLAGKKRRLLLGISGVEGWGLFTKTALKPNDFVGEYVGELVSTAEAEHRDEQEESKYLFDVNDTYAIDPLRRGNKVKFANHSWKPNCKPHIMQVGADYRVGIYAKQHIEAGSEIFYSYYPDVESSPEWARNLCTAKPLKDQRGRSSTCKTM
jgi:histone-lysine N-methyltransferase EZH2